MIKRAPTPARLGAMVIFALSCFGLLLYLWLAFGGATPLHPKGYRFTVDFPEAVALANQADVRIAGVDVGKVVHIEPTKTGSRTEATVQLHTTYAPLPRDTRAILRLKSLLGETYVELTPGNRRKGVVPDGGHLADSHVSDTVQLDEILRTFDPSTKQAFRTWMQSTAAAVDGRGQDINAAFGNLPGFVDSSDRILTTLDAQSAALRKTVSTTGEFFADISARQGQLSGLIRDADSLFRTTAARNTQFADVFRELPRFEAESSQTLPALTRFGKHAEPVIRQLQPVAQQLTPTFASLQQLAPEFNSFFHRLGPVVTASQKGLPAFETILKQLPPLLDQFEPFLRNANPIVSYIGSHQREVTAFFANVTGASLAKDTNSLQGARDAHYVRTAQTLTPEALAFYPRPLGQTRNNAYHAPGALDQLAAGLTVFNPATCSNGDVAPPASSDPVEIAPLATEFAFRVTDRNVARPVCKGQGAYPGFSTAFPQLRADP